VWLVNKAGNSVTELAPTGAALSPSTGFAAGSLNAPAALAVDTTGNIWVANGGNGSLAKLSSAGAVVTSYTGGGLNIPDSIAIDANANLWLGNAGNGTVSEFNSTGTPLSPGSGYLQPVSASPAVLAVNPH
jgi:DNA-binding beta-propeller fold protein YncE